MQFENKTKDVLHKLLRTRNLTPDLLNTLKIPEESYERFKRYPKLHQEIIVNMYLAGLSPIFRDSPVGTREEFLKRAKELYIK